MRQIQPTSKIEKPRKKKELASMSNLYNRISVRAAHSTSVDAAADQTSISWSSSFAGVAASRRKKYRGGIWSCFQRQCFDPEDAIYPKITKKLLAKYEDREEESRKGIFIKRREIDPNSYMTLHKSVAIGRFAVYYFGTEKFSNQPKIVKIYRPTVTHACSRRAGIEKQILNIEGKPAALPSVHFAFSYQFYKCLVLEPLCNISLEEKLLFARRLLPEVVQSFMVDMVLALSFLHTQKLIHRNLTLDSWWIQANHHLKLMDYSFCVHKRAPARWHTVFTITATEFTAPELFVYSPYSRQSDIWALGIIFYRMTCGRFPFYGSNPRELRKSIRKSKEPYDDFFTHRGQMLCMEMLEKEPAHRIGHLLKTEVAFKGHIYFNGVDWQAAYFQSKNGPPIRWKFPVYGAATETGSDEPLTINFMDPESYDLKKMKVKPLRMKAIKGGNYWFSPEYLEQQFPREIERDVTPKRESSGTRSSKAMRFSLHLHLLEAFKDLEKDLVEGDHDEDALKDYYSSIGTKISKYNEEMKTASAEKLAKTDNVLKGTPKGTVVVNKKVKKEKKHSADGSTLSHESTV